MSATTEPTANLTGAFKVVMALFDSELRDEMFVLLELSGIKNYTHFVGLHGSSNTGKKEGSVAWPGTNEILLLILSTSESNQFQQAVRDFKSRRAKSPGLLTFNWDLNGLT